MIPCHAAQAPFEGALSLAGALVSGDSGSRLFRLTHSLTHGNDLCRGLPEEAF
jgi:hypothetical protein